MNFINMKNLGIFANLTLNGNASHISYTNILRTLTYMHNGGVNNISNQTRELSVYAVDSGGARSITKKALINIITRTFSNYYLDYPASSKEYHTNYCEGGVPIPIVGNVRFTENTSIPHYIKLMQLNIHIPSLDDDAFFIPEQDVINIVRDHNLGYENNLAQKFIIITPLSNYTTYETFASKNQFIILCYSIPF